MSGKIAIRAQTEEPEHPESADQPTVVEEGRLFDRMKDLSQAVARRAFELFDSRGRQAGRALDDWLRAELDLLRSVPIEIRDSGANLIVLAEVPGLTAGDIDVVAEPRRVLISGKSAKSEEHAEQSVILTERSSKEVFRAVDLPTEIDPSNVTATLKHGILELTLLKVPATEPVQVQVTAGS